MSVPSETTPKPVITAATVEDIPELVTLLVELFEVEADFDPNPEAQRHGLQLLIGNPSRGRIFVMRKDGEIVAMANLLFSVSTALGGFALILEDLIVSPTSRGHGYGTELLKYVLEFARKKKFSRITLLTDRLSVESQRFFQRFGFKHSEMVPMRIIL